MRCLSYVYCVITPLHVSGVSTAHHQGVECIYVANGTYYTSELTVSGPGPLDVVEKRNMSTTPGMELRYSTRNFIQAY
jgi:hypothetical protein